jgi:hypothetical protein
VALPKTPDEWRVRLAALHDRELPSLRELNDEYELRAKRMYMHPEIFRELGDRLQQVVIAWAQLVVDSLEERLDVEGFRLPGQAKPDGDLWRVWQENGCDEQSQLAHIDALVMRRSYICVGANEADDQTPLVTFESPLEVFGDVDPRTRTVRAALRRYVDTEAAANSATGRRYATLYLPDRTVYFVDEKIDQTDEHGLGVVPIVPIINRSRLSDWCGRSELSPILPLVHAANKIATDMMVAAEFVALPLRGIFGIGPEDLEDGSGNKMTALQAILGRLLLLPDADGTGKQFEFPAADLGNFHRTINSLAQLVGSIAGLPPHYLGQATDNPPSADAIRSNEIRLVKRAERRQRAFGGAHEAAMRLVHRFQTGDWDPAYRRLETAWRDASTPTVAQKSDAAVKLNAGGIVPKRQTREDLGYTEAQIELMEAADDAEAANNPGVRAAAALSGAAG